MKVKVGDLIFDTHKEPIMLVLDDDDKHNIGHMSKCDYKYCKAPSVYAKKDLQKFMCETSEEHLPRVTAYDIKTHHDATKYIREMWTICNQLVSEPTIPIRLKNRYKMLLIKIKTRYKNLF